MECDNCQKEMIDKENVTKEQIANKSEVYFTIIRQDKGYDWIESCDAAWNFCGYQCMIKFVIANESIINRVSDDYNF